MAQRHHKVRAAAASILVECGPYARMAALFLAREAQEAGDADAHLLWTRVAGAIVEIEAAPASPHPRKLH